MLSAVLGPVDRCIIYDITVIGQLHEDFEFDGGPWPLMRQVRLEEVGTLCCDRGVVQIFDCSWLNYCLIRAINVQPLPFLLRDTGNPIMPAPHVWRLMHMAIRMGVIRQIRSRPGSCLPQPVTR